MRIHIFFHRSKRLSFNKVIDLGCGRGRHSLLFAKNGYDVTAVNLSKYAIKELVKKAKKDRLNIECKVIDMLKLSFKDNYYDCLFTYHVISHSVSKEVKTIISEISRIVKYKGEVFVTFGNIEILSMIN
ncbi:MAG: class I SAM-dependent methyltransferase [Candidatus Izimaplasma sp.]|nr:class I SAM-dependent methyltransferase [Candidatus Izimaplasma bacterium]